ncbi:ABC transporter permease subunit [bacterium]|nr:ABC transporter permease subunit [bacterium]
MSQNHGKLKRLLHAPVRILDEIRLVAAWDMTRQARRPSFFLMRVALAGFIAFQVTMLWWGQIEERRWNSDAQNAAVIPITQLIYAVERIFSGTVLAMSVGLVLFCPALTSGSIAGDRERKIWHDLANSPLSGWSILMGKMVARLATVFAWILVAMPLWALLSLVGGLDPLAISLIMLGLFLYGWIYAALGLLASVVTKRSRDALGLVTSVVCLLIFVPLVAPEIIRGFKLPTFGLEDPLEYVMLFNPVMTMHEVPRWINEPPATRGNAWISLPRFFLLIGLTGPLLTLLAGLLLRPMGRRLDSAGSADRAVRTGSEQTRKRRFRLPWPDFSGIWPIRLLHEPMIMKERRVRSGSRLTRNLRRLALGLYFVVTLGMLLSYLPDAFFEWLQVGYYGTRSSARNTLMSVVLGVTGTTAAVLHYALMLDAAGRVVMEKEQDTWTTLLATTLTPREILAGKAFGAFWSWRWAFFHLLFFWFVATILGAINPLGVFCAVVVWSIQLAFVTVLGLRIGMNSTTHAGIVSKCIGMYLILNIALPVISAYFIRDEFSLFTQPSIMATSAIVVGDQSTSNRFVRDGLAFGVLWEFVLLVITGTILFEILATFDRKTGRE